MINKEIFKKQLWYMSIVLEELFSKYCREIIASKKIFILIIKLLVKDQDHQEIGNRPKHFNFPHKITKLSA